MRFAALSIVLSILCVPLACCEDKTTTLPTTAKKKDMTDAKTIPENHETITLGGGCFWCVEAVYQQLEGVYSVTSGYMGGTIVNPTYEQVCSKTTGHVEVVQVKFDPEKLPLKELLEWFWELHDPTTLDRQGHDVGPQYASVIFYHSEAQKKAGEESQAVAQKGLKKPIVTRIEKAATYYKAEGLHQDFYFLNKNKNPYCQAIITPKLKKLKLKH